MSRCALCQKDFIPAQGEFFCSDDCLTRSDMLEEISRLGQEQDEAIRQHELKTGQRLLLTSEGWVWVAGFED